ncbi:sensor histidine kinase [Pseudomonas sp. JS3066]|jgi:signal transduction histidine kinase|uniref:sensor histidine kinase n=1 Tax=unclassified Pseudomonas TaxID=196821 RepID=UPI00129E376E|nr:MULTISPECIES: sensor histidine kinase [unclassified Pseudomonas]MDH4653780.1 sensor histidine kinase [Pseudomonas sp. BN606]MRK22746.1 sensor histidine kinase [Pseudomonas sp. JG-B]WVK91116.1 sensor histidine kinase [Pseudomonas sp. JS3066]
MRSIQRRLSLGLVGVLLLVGLVLAQTSLWLFDLGLRRYLAEGLRSEAELLLGSLVRGQTGIQLDEKRLNPAHQQPYSGRYFIIQLDDEPWRSRSLWDAELPMPANKGLAEGLLPGPDDQELLAWRGDYRRFGRQVRIVVAQDYTPVLESFRRVRWMGLALGAAGLLLILTLQRITVRRALRPLEEVRQQIAQLQQGQRSELDSQVPEELELLVTQINRLLSHTEDTLKRSRNALGNLGHALKTPLAVLVSLANREELRDQPELRAILREQLEQIEQRLGRELGRARLAGEALPGAHFDCAEELPGLFSTLAMIHERGLDLDWDVPEGLRLPWDREDLLELLGNLLDNACKWAETQVNLTIRGGADGYSLMVDDDGPGIAEDKREEVIGRGARLDEQVAGHGLGLGIVRDIVESWNGRLSLQESPLGGLRVRIELPAAMTP